MAHVLQYWGLSYIRCAVPLDVFVHCLGRPLVDLRFAALTLKPSVSLSDETAFMVASSGEANTMSSV